MNVPNRTSILIHMGNFATGKKIDTEGCILVGAGTSILCGNAVVTNSRDAFTKLFTKLQAAKDEIILEIR